MLGIGLLRCFNGSLPLMEIHVLMWQVLVIDHADVITMQTNSTMFFMARYLDGYAPFHTQTILLSYYSNPDINNLFNKHCSNYHGKVKLVHEHKGVLPKAVHQVRQIYQRFDADSIQHFDDARFEYFTTKVSSVFQKCP
ncbi:unnamed protein product [Malus baccata var. baccata]